MTKANAVVHSAVKEGSCLDCHLPHVGAFPRLLTKKVPELCSDCHDLTQAGLIKSHGGFDIRQAKCITCHEPHVSVNKGLLNEVTHSPFLKGDCIACHEK